MTSSQPGQPGHPSASRALPDAIDLRLLAALTGAGGTVGLPQAAWNAGIPQADASARLVQLAESGFPLRLVVEGDARLLHQVIERGPVVPPAPQPSPATGGHPAAAAPAQPSGVGAGCKPPEFLKAGDVMELGVEGLGRQRQHVLAYAATF